MHTPITEKQIQELQPGDAILIHGSFVRDYSDGDLGIRVKEINIHTGKPQKQLIFVSSACVSLPPKPPTSVGSHPQYDPCREFKKGDRVRVRKIHGNLPQCRYNGMVKVKEGDCCTIHSKEHRNCYWVTIPSGAHYCFDIAYFELVTPVEELEPYIVVDAHTHWDVADKDMKTVATYSKGYHPNAKAAAEAECARLNAAHRKER